MEGLFSPYFVLKYINLHLEIISDIQSHQFIKCHTPSVPEILLTLRLGESRMSLLILLSVGKEKVPGP